MLPNWTDFKRVAFLGAALCLATTSALECPTDRLIASSAAPVSIGAKERVLLQIQDASGRPVQLTLNARVDTGAREPTLHATGISKVEIDGKPYVRFQTQGESGPVLVQAPLVKNRDVRSSDGKLEDRYVVSLRACIAGKWVEFESTLSDRAQMKSPMLLGRTFLKGRYVVDVQKTYTLETPKCK